MEKAPVAELRRLAEQERLVDDLGQALDNFANLNIDLSLLQGEKQFLDLQLGVVPRANLGRLTEAGARGAVTEFDLIRQLFTFQSV